MLVKTEVRCTHIMPDWPVVEFNKILLQTSIYLLLCDLTSR